MFRFYLIDIAFEIITNQTFMKKDISTWIACGPYFCKIFNLRLSIALEKACITLMHSAEMHYQQLCS